MGIGIDAAAPGGGAVPVREEMYMESKRRTAARVLAWLLCLLMVLSVFDGTGLLGGQALAAAGTAGGTPGVNQREADPSTMETYTTALLSEDTGSRYAGRVWTDKTVFAYGADQNSGGTEGNRISLTADLDGYESSMGFTSDFAHVFSALTSSQVVNEYPPTPIDMVLVLDISSSMSDDKTIPAVEPYAELAAQGAITHTRFLNLIYSADRIITQLMKNNPENRVSVVVYDRRATVIMPLAHYEANTTPVSQIGGGKDYVYDTDYLKDGVADGTAHKNATAHAKLKDLVFGYLCPYFDGHSGEPVTVTQARVVATP